MDTYVPYPERTQKIIIANLRSMECFDIKFYKKTEAPTPKLYYVGLAN